MNEPRKSWQDDKPWSSVDAELDREREKKERDDNNQKEVGVSLNKPLNFLFGWFINLFRK
jgi:hypothetical protein